AIVLPKTQQHYAHQILEKLCRRVENTPCPYEDEDGNPQELDYTVSVGFVGVTEINSTDIDLYLKQSDEALYHTKENGRNGVTCYNNLNSPDPDTSQSENVTPLARPQKQDAQH
ncbi:MAG TPA: diguanylate cyclase, partial [Micavibrio sp.]|nr:diguanylate cyclase [Micavibrio sp.]